MSSDKQVPAGWQQYRSLADLLPPSLKQRPLLWKCSAEFVGTFFLVVFGVGSVCSAVLTQQLQGLWQVTVVWGFGISIAIYCTASVSGAHLNPAVSLAMAILRPKGFQWRELLPYWAAQMLGGVAGGLVNMLAYYDYIQQFEDANGIKRGEPKSVFSAMVFGEYFPNPGVQVYRPEDVPEEDLHWNTSFIPSWYAFLVEGWGTAILMFVILAVTDKRQKAVSPTVAPFLIGFTIAVVMSLYAPITQGGLNPARDFGPRLVAVFYGWGSVAIPGPRDGFWVYIFGPLLGAPIGGALFDLMVGSGMGEEEEEHEVKLLFSPHLPPAAARLGGIDLGNVSFEFAKEPGTDRILYRALKDGGTKLSTV